MGYIANTLLVKYMQISWIKMIRKISPLPAGNAIIEEDPRYQALKGKLQRSSNNTERMDKAQNKGRAKAS